MKRNIFLNFLLLFPFFLSAQLTEQYVPGELLVQLNSGVLPETFCQHLKKVSLAPFSLNKVVAKRLNVISINFPGSSDHEKFLSVVKLMPDVKAAQFNHFIQERVVPDDTNFGSMWGLQNSGQSSGTPGADIDAPLAWDISTGGVTATGDTIVVAVIDGGFDLNHEDLDFWKNRAEIPGNLIDDDNNGYVDDYNGWNAVNQNGTITSQSHGTHVSGTVGARGNNSVGVTGVNWTVKILPVIGSTSTESIAVAAYNYVLDQRHAYDSTNGQKGAFIVSTNASFGVDYGQPANFPIWCAVYDSLGKYGILNAGATANLNIDVDDKGDIPTACTSDFMISVTNTTRTDIKYTSAAYGDTTIDIGAPGTSIMSTLPNNSYGNNTGTSMATPHVAGAIALMFSAACTEMMLDYKAKPDSVARLMKKFMLENIDSLAALTGKTVTGGRLNLYKSLWAVLQYSACPGSGVSENGLENENFSNQAVFPNPFDGIVQFVFNSKINSEATIMVTDILGKTLKNMKGMSIQKGRNNISLDLSDLSPGIYFLYLNSGDGNSVPVKIVAE